MSQIRSAALQFFASALGITRLDSDTQNLEDGIVTPVFDIGNVTALGLGSGTKGGYFYGQLRSTRTGGAGTSGSTVIDPYSVVGVNGYPSPGIPASSIPPDLDVWLIAVSAVFAAVNDFGSFGFRHVFAEVNRGWSTTLTGPQNVTLAFWDSFGSFSQLFNSISGVTRFPLNLLFPRGDTLSVLINTTGVGESTATAVVELWVGPKGHKPPTAF